MFDLVPKSDPGARMQIVGLGELMHPGTCMVCGSGTRDSGYVRLGVYYDYEGEMYLCKEFCLPELIKTVNGLTEDEAKTMVDMSNTILEQHEALKAELERANGRLLHYDSLLNVSPINGPASPGSVADSGESEGSSDSDSIVTVSGYGKSKSKESTKSRRLDDPERTTSSNRQPPSGIDL